MDDAWCDMSYYASDGNYFWFGTFGSISDQSYTLWVSDGTLEGTKELLRVQDIYWIIPDGNGNAFIVMNVDDTYHPPAYGTEVG